MRLIFMGTPVFAAAILEAILDAGHEVLAVYTQPPKPRGRGRALQPTPVEALARRRGIEVKTPHRLREAASVAELKAYGADAAVVAAYGQILTQAALDAPRLGCFNVHASLLPRWRGAAPIQRAIMAGDRVTGVQIMRMTAGLDEGPILSEIRVAIEADDTADTLHDRLMAAACELTPKTLSDIDAGVAVERPQASEGATYARKISPTEGRIDWRGAAIDIDRQIRGLSPHPGAWFFVQTPKGPLRVKALSSRVGLGRGEPGETLDHELLVACGEGAVRLLRVQREGRTPQDGAEFYRGLNADVGAVLN